MDEKTLSNRFAYYFYGWLRIGFKWNYQLPFTDVFCLIWGLTSFQLLFTERKHVNRSWWNTLLWKYFSTLNIKTINDIYIRIEIYQVCILLPNRSWKPLIMWNWISLFPSHYCHVSYLNTRLLIWLKHRQKKNYDIQERLNLNFYCIRPLFSLFFLELYKFFI